MLGCAINITSAQTITKDDYQRAESFLWSSLNNKYIYNLAMDQYHFADSSGMWQLFHDENGKRFEVVWFDELQRKPLFDHSVVAQNLTQILGEEVDPNALPFDNFQYKDGKQISISINDKTYDLNLSSGEITEAKEEGKKVKNEFESESPDGKWVAYSKDYNLFIKSKDTGEEYQLSTDGKKGYEYASYYAWDDLIKGENGERPKRFSVTWSADSKWVYTNVCDLRNANKMYLLDYSVDTLFRPTLYSYYRGSPGDTTMVYLTPVFYNVESKKEIGPRFDKRTHINDYYILWYKNQDKVLLADYKRGYQKVEFWSLDLTSGNRELLFTETSETRAGNKTEINMIDGQMIFTSERSGWNHIYAHDFETKKTKALTKGSYVVNSVVKIAENTGTVYFMASGKNEGMNPYHQQLYSVSLSGKKLKLLTPEPIHHRIKFSPGMQHFSDRRSTVQTLPWCILYEMLTTVIFW